MTISLEQAQKAKNALKVTLARPAWLKGIGIGQDDSGNHVIEVRIKSDLPEVREAIPAEVGGVSVKVTAIGETRSH